MRVFIRELEDGSVEEAPEIYKNISNFNKAPALMTKFGFVERIKGFKKTDGKVKYIDYRKQFSKIGRGAFWYKRKSFEHEREVRALIRNHENTGKGVSHPVDLDVLIKNVYVSPYAPEWFAQVVRDVVKKYHLDKPVVYSSMKEQPFY